MPIRRLFQLQARKSTIESSLDETEESQKSKPQVRKTMSTRSTPILRRRSRFMAMNRSYDSTDSSNCSGPGSIDLGGKTSYRIMFLGSSQSGKTSIIRQFLYDKFSHFHTETMDDMYRGEFEDLSGNIITFDIQDVGGNYVYEFPSMRSVSMKSADAFVLVFSLDDSKSWEEVYKLRDMIIDAKDPEVPIVVVGNKSDLQTDSDLPFESLEATALFDWENGFVQCSAKQNLNIKKIFKELLNQAKPRFGVNLPNGGSLSKNLPLTNLLALQQKASKDELHLKRRQSLPIVPAAGFGISAVIPDAIEEEENSQESEEKPKKRRSSFAALRRESCKIS